jgi:chromatin remodeling complex protein RSC6
VVSDADAFATQFSSLLEKIQSLSNELRGLATTVKNLQKDHSKFVRENSRKNAKRQTKKVNRAPSGFAHPTLLSKEMYAFLGKKDGELVVRNDVIRQLNAYVVDNNLREPTDKRRIVPDAKLKSLVNVPDGETLTYFNIQKYIKHHFIKPTTASA